MRMEQVWSRPFGQIASVEVERLFDAFLPNRHFALRPTRDIHGLLRVTIVDVRHTRSRPQLGLLVAMLIISRLSLKASQTASL